MDDFGNFLRSFQLKLDDDGVVGRAEAIGKGFCKARGRADRLFNGSIHGGIARGAGDSLECDRPTGGDLNFDLGRNLFSSGDRWFFPSGLNRLLDESAVPGEIVGYAIGPASVARSVSSSASLFGWEFGGETILNIGSGGAGWGGGFFGAGFAYSRGGGYGDLFLGGADFDLVFGCGGRLGHRLRKWFGFRGWLGFGFGLGCGRGWGGGWFGLFGRSWLGWHRYF